jgi:hypothetical protein
MLYHRLLNELMSISNPFDFTSLWGRLHLKPFETFSTLFLVQARLLLENDTFPITSLDGLAKTWGAMVQEAAISVIDTNLTIVYRLQPATPNRKHRGKGKMRTRDVITNLGISQEDSDLAQAIEASLNDTHRGSHDQHLDGLTSKEANEPILKSNSANDGQSFTYLFFSHLLIYYTRVSFV